MSRHAKIDYLEFASRDLASTKHFFESVFDWQFTDYGPEYTAFTAAGIPSGGGFYYAEMASKPDSGGALVVFYSDDLAETQGKIESAGGKIVKPIFSFPGGSRFHFEEPSGNEFAVWTEHDA